MGTKSQESGQEVQHILVEKSGQGFGQQSGTVLPTNYMIIRWVVVVYLRFAVYSFVLFQKISSNDIYIRNCFYFT